MCQTKNCRKKQIGKKSFCSSCNIRRFKEKNPEKYAYFVLKNNAKRRWKVFTISFEYFKQFVVKTEYMAGKGITKTGLHIDRIKEHLGYVEGNLQILTNTENVKKYISFNYDPMGNHTFTVKKSVVLDDANEPF